MKKFSYLDITTSDVCFVAYGKTLDELFENSALAMFEAMVNTEQIKSKVKRKVEVKGNDLESLMFNWLNELLVFYGSENLAFSKFDVDVNKEKLELKARCGGEELNPEKHELRTEVKACTMHKLKVWKEETWKARVILDI